MNAISWRQTALWPYIAIALLCLGLCYGSFLFLLTEAQAFTLTREDGPYEWVSALLFLITALIFLFTCLAQRRQARRMTFGSVVFLLLGLLFLFGFFEEISWGQRIFNIATPDYFKEANLQGEINLHNLGIFHARDAAGNRKSGLALMLSSERLFSLFWLTFCCLIPAAYRLHKPTKQLLATLGFPIVPLALGAFFPINYALSKVIPPHLILRLRDPLIEVKECGFACLFLIVSVWFFHHYAERATTRCRKKFLAID